MQRILAATDFSDDATNAVRRATLLCAETGAQLTLTHVFNQQAIDRLLQWGMEKLRQPDVHQMACQALQEQAHRLQSQLGPSSGQIRLDVRTGHLIKSLNAAIDESRAQLLVCAARGQSVLRHHLLGTTALRMLSATQCPLLVVKASAEQSYRRALVAVDFSNNDHPSFDMARAVAPDASLFIANVAESPFGLQMRYANIEQDVIEHYRGQALRESREALRALRNLVDVQIQDENLQTLQGDPANAIIHAANKNACDLIVLGRHGKGMLERWLPGSVTKQILEESPFDVLVV